eukprot:Filipodium_phascolosomae@DN2959_c0_g1_i1.p1
MDALVEARSPCRWIDSIHYPPSPPRPWPPWTGRGSTSQYYHSSAAVHLSASGGLCPVCGGTTARRRPPLLRCLCRFVFGAAASAFIRACILHHAKAAAGAESSYHLRLLPEDNTYP